MLTTVHEVDVISTWVHVHRMWWRSGHVTGTARLPPTTCMCRHPRIGPHRDRDVYRRGWL